MKSCWVSFRFVLDFAAGCLLSAYSPASDNTCLMWPTVDRAVRTCEKTLQARRTGRQRALRTISQTCLRNIDGRSQYSQPHRLGRLVVSQIEPGQFRRTVRPVKLIAHLKFPRFAQGEELFFGLSKARSEFPSTVEDGFLVRIEHQPVVRSLLRWLQAVRSERAAGEATNRRVASGCR